MACVTDMRGVNPKVRPAVLLSVPTDNLPDSQFRVACCSRTPPEGANVPLSVRAPGLCGPQGQKNPRTGLSETTWFYAGWIRTISVGDVAEFLKFLPEPERVALMELIEAGDKQAE